MESSPVTDAGNSSSSLHETTSVQLLQPSVYFVEANSEQELLDLCRGFELEQQFLHWDPVSGNMGILSRFSLWIHSQQTAGMEHNSRSKCSSQAPSTAVSTASRHWRQASTPERFTPRLNRLQSFHSKGFSTSSNHSSLPSLPDSASAPGSAGSTAEGIGLSMGSTMNLSASAFAHDTEDGPLFRATVVECENHIRDMKAATKRIIKAAQTVVDARKAWVVADEAFVKELEGFKPAEPLLNSYLRPISQTLAETSDTIGHQMRNLLIEPLTRFYMNDIKAAEVHRKGFDDESKEYYQFLSRYMAMKQDSNRKKSEADAKYEKKRRQFEVKRFEYCAFLLDMRVGGSKSDEILHHLTNYSEKHCRNLIDMALLAEDLKPGLELIAAELLESHKRAAAVRKERQERRRELLESHGDGLVSMLHAPSSLKGIPCSQSAGQTTVSVPNAFDVHWENNVDTPRTNQDTTDDPQDSIGSADQRPSSGSSPLSSSGVNSAPLSNSSMPKFSGIRDLEHQDIDASSALGRRKEGFLFATSRPSMHNNSAVLEKPSINWHKYWCVVSEGHLHEYSHWKKGATMLHNEPINLKITTVRPCRNQDRRFCFEVITPKFRRVYQATSTEDMNSWVNVISNAIQSLLNGSSSTQNPDAYVTSSRDSKTGGGLGSEGPNSGQSGASRTSLEQPMHDRSLVGSISNMMGDPQSVQDSTDMDELGTRLLKIMRETHPANNFCAECGAKNPDWCAINLGILICIECSGIHRSLGTHISKVRSFTLDTTSYTRDLFDFIRSVGNDVSNKIWEANLIQAAPKAQEDEPSNKVVFRRPLVDDAREYKVTFIQKKYVDRCFVDTAQYMDGADSDEGVAIRATRALFNAVAANNIPEVIAAFAAGADLNAVQEVEWEDEAPPASHVTMETDGTMMLSDSQTQSSLEGLSLSSEGSSRLSRSTIASSILNVPLVGSSSHLEQAPSDHHQEVSSSSNADLSGSSFMVMQTSPLLLALRHGVPCSLDEQYEVYPMAEFMLQNGAASNLSVEVRLIDDDGEYTGQGAVTDGDVINQNAPFLTTDGSSSTNNNIGANNDNGWDSPQIDPEDIRNHRERNNRRSLGQVVHMRGEGGGTAMEYLRAKSAARGDPMPGSPFISTSASTSCHETGSITGISASRSSSPPSMILSPRLRPQQQPIQGGVGGSFTTLTSAISSPTAPGSGPPTIVRQQSTSMHQDISMLFHKRHGSDGGLGPAAFAADKTTESGNHNRRPGLSGATSYRLQNAATVPSSPIRSSSDSWTPSAPVYSHSGTGSTTLHHSSSRAHKVKASLSKSLKMSAAYIKNNMMKDDKDSHLAIPQAVMSSSSMSATPSSSRQFDIRSSWSHITSPSANNEEQEPLSLASTGTASASAPTPSTSSVVAESPLSGPYVILHKKDSNSDGH
ncbi:hypothetical protein EDD11_000829 [Mortierella claussenii]|nr:hypothetical protein EDD11_000829 [Mortierella claussenii]